MKANWSCTICGMYSSRRYSVQRHINRMHVGYGKAIPFVEYLVGRRNGWYPPRPTPSFTRPEKSLSDKMVEEAEKVFARRVAEGSLPPVGDPRYNDQINLLKSRLYKRNP